MDGRTDGRTDETATTPSLASALTTSRAVKCTMDLMRSKDAHKQLARTSIDVFTRPQSFKDRIVLAS